MPLGGLQHYTIEPQDLETTKEFYCDVLGLENGDLPRSGDTQIFLHDPDGVGVELNFAKT